MQLKILNYFLLFGLIVFICCNKPNDLVEPNLITSSIQPSDISVSISNDSVPADGKTYSSISIMVGANILLNNKDVTFNISPIGQFSNGSNNFTTKLDVNGRASVSVYSDTPGISCLTVTVDTFTVESSIQFYNVNALLLLTILNDSVNADNYSYAVIQAKSNNTGALKNMNTITFTTDKGIFSNDSNQYTIFLGLDSIAKAYVKYNQADSVKVTATISNAYTKDVFVQFIPSWPQQIFIEPGLSTMVDSLGSQNAITVNLYRSIGSVSEGEIVLFKDSTIMGASIGSFFNTTLSSDSGVANSIYSIQDTAYRGFVYIKGYVVTNNHDTISGTNRILVK